jgi:uncharacterized membrane protein
MYTLVPGIILLIAFGSFGWYIVSQMRVPLASRSGNVSVISAERYRPMLRLLSDDDLNFVSSNAALRKSLRARRRELFRSYLRCLTRDYLQLLGGVRAAMAQAGMDRPELAQALVKNRILFFVAMYKVELRLALHAAGIGKVDISGMVEALEALRNQVGAMSAVSAAAAA